MPYSCGFEHFCPGLAYQVPVAKAFPWATVSRGLFFAVVLAFVVAGIVRKRREAAQVTRLAQARPLAERILREAHRRGGGGLDVNALAGTIAFMVLRRGTAGLGTGLDALQEGRLETAEDALATMGNSLIARGGNKAAAEIFAHLGNIALLHDAEKATQAYAMAAELNPGNAAILLNLAILRRRAGDIDAAIAAFQRMLAIGTKTRNRAIVADAATHLGDLFEARGASGEAEWMFRKALVANQTLKREPGVAHLRGRLSALLARRGDAGEGRATP